MSKYNIQEIDLETGKQVRLTGYSNAAFEDPLRSKNNDCDQSTELQNRLGSVHACSQDDKTANVDGKFAFILFSFILKYRCLRSYEIACKN